jgi:glycosyltransferase involved in cell wall biosynthesis
LEKRGGFLVRVLFYIEPLPEKRPLWKKAWLDFVARFVAALSAEDSGEDQFALVVSDALAPLAAERFPDIQIVEIRTGDLIPEFGVSALEAATKWYFNSASDAAINRMTELLREKLLGFEADVCITLSPAPFLRSLFPHAATLNFEYGMLSRAPFPETGFLDPVGIYNAGILGRFREELLSYSPSARELDALDEIRRIYSDRMQGHNNPLASILAPKLAGMRAVILVALQFSDFYCYDAHATFPEQADMLRHVLETTPPDVAVIACEHPEHPLFDDETLAYYLKRFPNLVWAPEFRSTYASGQYLLEFADAVVTVSSSVGLQAPLWKKKLILLGASHLDIFADAHSMSELEQVLERPWVETRDHALIWLLTRYYLPFEVLFDPSRLRANLEKAIEQAGEIHSFSSFKRAVTPARLTRIYARAANRWLTHQTAPTDAPDLLNVALFSAAGLKDFEETTCARATTRLGQGRTTVVLSTPKYEDPLRALRIQFSDRPRQLFLHSLVAKRGDGSVLWKWSGQAADILAPGVLAITVPELHSALIEVLTPAAYFDIQLAAVSPAAEFATVEVVLSNAPLWEAANVKAAAYRRSSSNHEILSAVAEVRNDARVSAERVSEITTTLNQGLQQQLNELRKELANVSLDPTLLRYVEQKIDLQGNETVKAIGLLGDETQKAIEQNAAEQADRISELIAALQRDYESEEEGTRNAGLPDATQSESAEYLTQFAAELSTFIRESHKRLLTQIADTQKRDNVADNLVLERLRSLDERLSKLAHAERSLEEQKREAIDLRTEVKALRASTSWVVTAPLRAIRSIFARGRDKAPRQQLRTSIADAPAEKPPTESTQTRAVESRPVQTNPAIDFEPIRSDGPPAKVEARAIAFYLPQFHPIPENDEWWGKGFTEWTNVTKATPQYEGHYQPHLPGELGFYDLRILEVMQRQVELAKLYGIEGFCFYFYWFAGKRLLEQPLLQWLDNVEAANLPFCLCWANENWSRRWDGLDTEILIGQQHSAEDDLQFIAYVAKYMRDTRYIRVDGKPMLLVYRPSLLPDPKATAERWRNWCRQNGLGEIHLVLTQSFDMGDPEEYGFDAAVEFPPNNMAPPDITERLTKLNPKFAGRILDYDFYVERSEAFPQRPYKIYRGAFPSWDNEARRASGGASFYGAHPEKFFRMMRNAVEEMIRASPDPDGRLLFINAWNEWAEGCHLEPDRRYGYAWLNAARRALADEKEAIALQRKAGSLLANVDRLRMVLVVHDGYRHGAQYLALNIARYLRLRLGLELDIVILGDGPLKSEFQAFGTVHDLAGLDSQGQEAKDLARKLRTRGNQAAICNTTVTGLFLRTLSEAGFTCVALIHELPGLIASYRLHGHVEAIQSCAHMTVYSSEMVRGKIATSQAGPSIVRTQGLYKRNAAQSPEARAASRARLRDSLGLSHKTRIVLTVGFGDLRKGIDLWIDIGARVMREHYDVAFLWVGEIEATQRAQVEQQVANSGVGERFRFVGFQDNTDLHYAGADVYALTSREDPFPTVIMEALDVGVPVIAFEGAGGFSDLLHSGCGVTVPMLDLATFAKAISELLRDEDAKRRMGQVGEHAVRTQFAFGSYCHDLLSYAGLQRPRVSVIVPNYNYARHMTARLETSLKQVGGVFEVIVLDDASTDDSVAVISAVLATEELENQLLVNAKNSGSPFKQWLKGATAAKGDVVWIAEADDLTLPGFIEELLPAFEDPEVVMAYCQSKQMAEDGSILCDDYLDYVADIDRDKWRSWHKVSGLDEIRTALAVKNTVPNVSACLFRRSALLHALSDNLESISQYRVAGDWATYIQVLKQGKLVFTPKALNLHRRHERSVTLGSQRHRLLDEILSMQQYVRQNFMVSQHIQAKARAYAQELYQQFGFAKEGPPEVDTHPSFAGYFRKPARAAE